MYYYYNDNGTQSRRYKIYISRILFTLFYYYFIICLLIYSFFFLFFPFFCIFALAFLPPSAPSLVSTVPFPISSPPPPLVYNFLFLFFVFFWFLPWKRLCFFFFLFFLFLSNSESRDFLDSAIWITGSKIHIIYRLFFSTCALYT